MHGDKVYMHGSENGIGLYNGLRVANIEAEVEEGVVNTVITIEHSITGPKGEAFSMRGDSGAMVNCKRRTAIGTQNVVIRMVYGGFEKERITRFTRADFLVEDIMEVTKARDIGIFWV
jgi:hypothetical protein